MQCTRLLVELDRANHAVVVRIPVREVGVDEVNPGFDITAMAVFFLAGAGPGLAMPG